MDFAEISRQLAADLKAYRFRENLTQVDLAELLGVSMRAVQDWESGKGTVPRASARRRIAELLDPKADAA